METLIGRENERRILLEALTDDDAHMIAIFGRRRVGKTFLVRQTYGKHIKLDVSGLHNGTLTQQLENLQLALRTMFPKKKNNVRLVSWLEGFDLLKKLAEPMLKRQKIVLFFDEFPWMNTRKSGFLAAFENFWNSWGIKQKNLVVVICGSAASWMIRHVINNRGGLHNRITHKIPLQPFTLRETELYLRTRRVNLDRYQLLQLYMAMGGIPQYLKEVRPGQSAAQNIDRICFSKDGLLHSEFKNLYRSLFEEADHHVDVVRTLSQKPSGMTRTEIIGKTKLTSGGGATKILEELEHSGFISATIPLDRNSKETIYRLSDEYSLFYMKFMQSGRRLPNRDAWKRMSETPSWRSWSGYAFESICLKHIEEIRRALGISGIATTDSAWRHSGSRGGEGTQIDLLIDRSDRCINICEIKFSSDQFTITKQYADELERKLKVFKNQVKSKKTLFLTLITTFGVVENAYKVRLVQNSVTMDDLF